MADGGRYLPNQNQSLDIDMILQEAQHRWLRPIEILEILGNYQKFQLSPEPPWLPPAGSLFLFDRKSIRYFRKDGHRWKKKKDGKTVGEAHEKLKAGSLDVLNCYYAHGEEDANFQRRCYWMLDEKLEHIVLVHYREVKERYRPGVAHFGIDPNAVIENLRSGPACSYARTASPASTALTSYTSSQHRNDWSGQTLSSEYEDVDSRNGPGTSSQIQCFYAPMSRNSSSLQPEVEGFSILPQNPPGSPFADAKIDRGTHWPESHFSSRSIHDHNFFVGQPDGASINTHKLLDSSLDDDNAVRNIEEEGDRLITDVTAPSQIVIKEHELTLIPPQFSCQSGSQTAAVFPSSAIEIKSEGPKGAFSNEVAELKKLDSFGRWMDKELGGDCDDTLMASDSGTLWNAIDAENNDKEVSSLSHHMQLSIDSLGPSLSQEQLFSIIDFSPDWAYCDAGTKVLISGTFLGSKKPDPETRWGCMFGEIEVHAEVLTDNVIRCQAPPHVSGRVPFYVTCCNRLACSEVREFEYRETPFRIPDPSARQPQEEEICFQVRLTKLLYLGSLMKWLSCSMEGCNSCKLRTTLDSMRNDCRKDPGGDAMVSEGNRADRRDTLIQSLLEDRLCEWLICKVHEGDKGPDVLDDEGQGVIHLAAGLGYEWAVRLIVATTRNPNFRDARGRTALHWASYFGREEAVISLLRLAMDPTAVDDPTPAFPGGRSAADLASCQGHKGIAAYLAEAFLTRHLSMLKIKQQEINGAAATIAAEQAAESVVQFAVATNKRDDQQLSLKGSLAAVRKSAHAAALIKAAYRAISFRLRQTSEENNDLASLVSLNKVQNRGNFEEYLHSAAVKIQQKYRGWRGKKEFLKIRNRIVKIQAHVRGHQARKQYKKLVWSVSIVEKAILRWRRKRSGLRGFRAGEEAGGDLTSGAEKTDDYEFLRISRRQKFAGVEKALARVTSMVRNPEARDQYMRMANSMTSR